MKTKPKKTEGTDNSTIITGEFNTPVSPMDSTTRGKISKKTEDLNTMDKYT
jgi:hypothetical protein